MRNSINNVGAEANNVKNGSKKDVSQKKEDLVNLILKVDPNNADRTWHKYGHILSPVMLPDREGVYKIRAGHKVWFDFNRGELPQEAFRDLLQNKSVFYPFEEITSQLKTVINGELKEYELKMRDWRFSRYEKAGYCEVISEKKYHVVPDSHIKDDKVYFGAVVRNGIGINLSLGADLYTFREICSNGAVARSQKLGSIAINHVGTYQNMTQRFAEGIKQVFASVKRLMDYYDEMANINLTQEALQKVYARSKLPLAYMPRYVDMEKDKKAVHGHKVRLKEKNTVPLWKFFNDITKPMNKALDDKMGFQRFEQKTTQLHLALVQIVDSAKRGR